MKPYEVDLHARVQIHAESEELAIRLALESVTSAPALLYPTACIAMECAYPAYYKSEPTFNINPPPIDDDVYF